MKDLLSAYGPNMAELERSIGRRGTKGGASAFPLPEASAGASAGARQSPFAEILKGQGPQGTSLPPPKQGDPAADLSRYTPEQIAQARKTSEDFEAFFISQMLQPMFENLNTEAPFGGGNSERIWRSLMVDEYGKMVVKNGGVGVADAVMKEMLKTQEG